MATVAPPPPTWSGVVFQNVSWADYEAQLRIVGERPIRVIFDRGTMVVVMPSFAHDDEAYRLGRIVDILTEELDVEVKAGRTTTHKRQDLERGAEPDQCHWFGENARKMAGKQDLDLSIDPPPDLAIEVDPTRSSLERLPIFGSIGIAEIWRIVDGSLLFLHLKEEGSYEPRDPSLAFPNLSAHQLTPFLEQGRAAEDTAWVRSFRALVRDVLIHHP
jgi:Uma2 family endonuclease